jgi:hypothetical protein
MHHLSGGLHEGQPPAVPSDAHGHALALRLAGLRLAPGGGLVLPDGSYLSRAAGLEAMLAAHPAGLELGAPTGRIRAAARRAASLLERHRVPMRVAWDGGRLTLVEAPGEVVHGRPA